MEENIEHKITFQIMEIGYKEIKQIHHTIQIQQFKYQKIMAGNINIIDGNNILTIVQK